MVKRQPKAKPTWTDVKAKLVSFDRAALLVVLQDLYAGAAANRAFLHARFGLGEDPVQPYKKTIDRWLWPDIFRAQETSVSRAKGAIIEYKRAIGDLEGLGELMVFYCERATGFCRAVGHTDPAYLDALVRMFGHALQTTKRLATDAQSKLHSRLDQVRNVGRQLGYGVGEHMDVLLAEFESSSQARGVEWREE